MSGTRAGTCATILSSLMGLCSCGDVTETRDSWPGVAPEALERAPTDRIANELEAAIAHARAHPSSASGIRASVDAGQLALMLTEREAHSELVGAARATLRRSNQEAGLPGLCDAALVEARLEHALAPSTERDLRRLGVLRARFDGLLAARACLAEAERTRARWASVAGARAPTASPEGLQPPSPASPSQSPRSDSERGTLRRIDVYGQQAGSSGESRVVLAFDRPVTYRRSERPARGSAPRRVVLDLDGAVLDPSVESALELGRGGVDRVRLLESEGAQVRVSFDIRDPTDYRMFSLPDPFRLVLDFRSARRAASGSQVRRVVLDPGHGGHNPGAKGPTGLRESDVALSLSRRVRQVLTRKAPGMQVLLTRDGDHDVSLEERAAVANAVDADLFVSIHLNASHAPTDPGGVSTFVLDTSDDRQALRLAARENGSQPEEVSKLQVVLAGLHRKEQVAHSRAAAEAVQSETLSLARRVLPELPDRGVKSAMFYVLVGALMPAVLVEASFITRPDEEQALRTDRYRAALAEGIAAGIVQYARARSRSAD